MKLSKARIKQQRLYVGGIALAVVLAALLAAWFGRAQLRTWYADAMKPTLPAEQPVTNTSTTGSVTPVNNGQTATGTQASSTKPSGFPKELNLSVPFVLQAPHQNWVLPYEEACEEATLIMAVNAGKKALTADQQKAEIDALVKTEMTLFNDHIHTNASETAMLAKEHYGVKEARVISIRSADDIKRELAAGHPVMIPANGKALKNPNFKNGGPVYHMLLIKGYMADGRWITHDPGTRNGRDYLYGKDLLLNAIHDWTGEAADGARVGLVVVP